MGLQGEARPNRESKLASISADVILGRHKNQCGTRLAGTRVKGVQQGENAGVSKRDSECEGSGNCEGDYESN